MDMSAYRDLFVSEARNHLVAFGELIVRLEDDSADRAVIDEIFRHAHSLKGMAATMQYDTVSTLAHKMEDLLGRVRNNEFPISPALADLLLEGSDLLSGMVTVIESGEGLLPDAKDLVERLAVYNPAAPPPPSPDVETAADTPSPPSEETSPRQYNFRQTDTFKSVRVKTETLDRLVNITGELLTIRHRLSVTARRCAGQELDEPLHQLSAHLRELRDEVFQARMLPFSFVAERLPRLVRDLARKQGKDVSLQIEGKDIELDRGILEEITEPLVHILRNAVDHGIEPPDERVSALKPACGVITLSVARDKDHVDIVVADDGRGMDPARIVNKAVEKGLLTSSQAYNLPRQEALMLVCEPGFSTSVQVSDVSGRGVGMDVVKSAVHNLGGVLSIESETGHGSRFSLRLPITVSIIHALIVGCGELTIAFPVNTVARTTELRREDILEEGGRKGFKLGERLVPLKSLNRLLHQPLPQKLGPMVPVVVSEAGGRMTGFVTEGFHGQEEIFVKPLGAPLNRMKSLTGGSVTGDGRIVFVVDASTLV